MATKIPSKKVFLLVGRDDWQKDYNLNHILRNYLKSYGYKIIWEDPAGSLIYTLRRIEHNLQWLPNSLKTINLRILQIISN